MSGAIVTIKTQGAGTDWDNTWGLLVDETSALSNQTTLTNVQLQGLLDLGEINSGTTNPNLSIFDGDQNILASIVAFHRMITYAPARIISIKISDGKKNEESGSVWWSSSLDLICLRDEDASGNEYPLSAIAPLNVSWLLNRNPAVLSRRTGRMYLRYVLLKSAIEPGTRDGVDWSSSSVSVDSANFLASVLSESKLADWMLSGAGPLPYGVGVPHYVRKGLPGEGDLLDVALIRSITSHNPVSRQLTRGKRRKPTNPAP